MYRLTGKRRPVIRIAGGNIRNTNKVSFRFISLQKKRNVPEKPQILLTNDDGIDAPGLKSLVECMRAFGELTVIAPKHPMSGVGHAITMRQTIEVEKTTHFWDIPSYSLNGTPADCVKYALAKHFDQKPDLVVSGINHGSNASVNMIYSGTVAAAVEGAFYGIPSVAFSSLNYDEDADLSSSKQIVKEIIPLILSHSMPRFTLWNVNIPDVDAQKLKGFRFCRQSLAHWQEEFVEDTNENGKQSFWLTGTFVCDDKDESSDIWTLENGYASVVPVYLDLTHHHYLDELKKSIKHEKIQ
jgi:5'-nucleotidase